MVHGAQSGGDRMPSNSAAHAGAGAATAKSQVPRPRRQQSRTKSERARRTTEPPSAAAKTGGLAAPSLPALSVPRIRVPGNVLWWGGLAAVAALGIVDWPVVALVAAGTWVAEQHSRHPDRAQSAR